MVGQVSVKNSAMLRATIYAIKQAPADIRKDIRAQTRSLGVAIARDAMRGQSATPQQTAVIKSTVKVAASDQNVRVRSAGSKRKAMSGGATPYATGKAFEFGTNQNKLRRYRRSSRNGGAHVVNRHTARQMPERRRTGYVFYPAVAEMVPRILALWTQTAVRAIADALDGK